MDLINFLEKLNWQTIIAMLVITWYFTKDLKDEMQEQGKRIDHLYQVCIDLLKEKK